MQDQKKTYSNFNQNCYFPSAPSWIEALCNDCITCQLNKSYPHQKQLAEKQDFRGQVYISTTESHSIQKDQYHPLQKETHI